MPLTLKRHAGTYYPSNSEALTTLLHEAKQSSPTFLFLPHVKIQGLIIPHSPLHNTKHIIGTALNTLQANLKPETIIIISPNHYHVGDTIAVPNPKTRIETLTGTLEPDEPLITALTRSGIAKIDEKPFKVEHGVEVPLIALSHQYPDATVTPIIAKPLDLPTCKLLASAIARNTSHRRTLIAASSDLSHYMPPETAEKEDKETLKLIEQLNAEALWKRCTMKPTLMCGTQAVTTTILTCKIKGSTTAHTLAYTQTRHPNPNTPQTTGHALTTIIKT